MQVKLVASFATAVEPEALVPFNRNPAPNPSFKRTTTGVPVFAA
jgi:hypothetical protein